MDFLLLFNETFLTVLVKKRQFKILNLRNQCISKLFNRIRIIGGGWPNMFRNCFTTPTTFSNFSY